MDKRETLLLGLLVVAGAFAFTQANASTNNDYQEPFEPFEPFEPDQVEGLYTVSDDDKVKAFLKMIRKFESNDNYAALYGGGSFDDFSRHPWEGKPLPKHSAAGAYQFIIATWLRLRDKLSLPDFSPESQDLAAEELLNERDAMGPLLNDDINTALRNASKEWASLPYSTAGQNPKPLTVAVDTYNAFLNA